MKRGIRGHIILKPLLDAFVSLVGLLLSAIPFAIIALAIKLGSKGLVFFRLTPYSAKLGPTRFCPHLPG